MARCNGWRVSRPPWHLAQNLAGVSGFNRVVASQNHNMRTKLVAKWSYEAYALEALSAGYPLSTPAVASGVEPTKS
jgi:hypothetical protein